MLADYPKKKQLYLRPEEGMIKGVCAGIADYFAIPVRLVRIIVVLSMFFGLFMLTIAAAVMWACGNIVSRAVGRHGPVNQLAFVVWSSVVPPLPLLGLSLCIDGPAAISLSLRHFSVQSFVCVAYIAWASTLFGYAAWNFLISRYPVNRVAPFSLLVPLVGLTTGWMAFNEGLSTIQLAGAGLLMIGLLVNLFGASLMLRLGWRKI